MTEKKKYYRPIPIEGISHLVTIDGNNLGDNEWYTDKEICEDDFPWNEIKEVEVEVNSIEQKRIDDADSCDYGMNENHDY